MRRTILIINFLQAISSLAQTFTLDRDVTFDNGNAVTQWQYMPGSEIEITEQEVILYRIYPPDQREVTKIYPIVELPLEEILHYMRDGYTYMVYDNLMEQNMYLTFRKDVLYDNLIYHTADWKLQIWCMCSWTEGKATKGED